MPFESVVAVQFWPASGKQSNVPGCASICRPVNCGKLNRTGAPACGANAVCANKPGAYTCTCSTGYAGDGKVCTDIDECANGTAGCDTNAACANKPCFGSLT